MKKYESADVLDLGEKLFEVKGVTPPVTRALFGFIHPLSITPSHISIMLFPLFYQPYNTERIASTASHQLNYPDF